MPPVEAALDHQGLSRYAAIAAELRTRIAAGEWPPGTALPSEQVLAAQQGVAMATLRRALEVLAAQGVVERIHGRGTFVRAAMTGAPMLRFFRFGGASGEVPASRVLSRRKATPPAEVAEQLALERGGAALHVTRVRSLGGKPCLLEDLWLPLPLFAALADLPPAEWDTLFYPMYAQRCGVHVQRATDTIAFGTLAASEAAHLELAPGHPCARVGRRAFDVAGRCVEVRTTLGDAHAFHYTVQIT
ncbi:GntR family transcriptional regulator [Ramlibacter sp. USB13]|uniref:GntR family transcriptional regulator n=1 Tax=Ramlibacter cellulosilyticus TaxID=2764187 RepID=A0A923MVU0_9BURK|nr:GntR family transcriptional regulator [Ramlibacter cellulosilyticus]MBC5786320.1 GntR family transcriptional regulator [Ramlibacter cellulosilyticus]